MGEAPGVVVASSVEVGSAVVSVEGAGGKESTSVGTEGSSPPGGLGGGTVSVSVEDSSAVVETAVLVADFVVLVRVVVRLVVEVVRVVVVAVFVVVEEDVLDADLVVEDDSVIVQDVEEEVVRDEVLTEVDDV